GHSLHHHDDRGDRGRAGDRGGPGRRDRGPLAAGDPRVQEGAAAAMTAPFGRRLCEVAKNEPTGGYRVCSLLDREGPEPQPGQFYMLASEDHWDQRGGRPFLPRAISVAESGPAAAGVRLDFLIEGVGPGTDRLAELVAGERVWVNGPLGNAFADP